MAQPGPTLALALHHDRDTLAEVLGSEDDPQAQAAMQKYVALVRDAAVSLCGQRQFSHIEFVDVPTAYQESGTDSPLALVLGPPAKDASGQLTGTTRTQHVLDLYGALTASKGLPAAIADKVGLDEEGMLGFTDIKLGRAASKLNKRLGLDKQFTDTITEEDEEALAEALGAQVPAGEDLVPVHPEDLLSLLSAFLLETAGSPPRVAGGPVSVQALVKGLRATPTAALRLFRRSTRTVSDNAWRAQELGVAAAQLALRVARKSARPLILAFILRRAASTIAASKDVHVRMAKLPMKEAFDLYYRTLLGDDYQQQFENDLLDAVAEVDAGLITEDYKEEKRLLTARLLRDLEVKEWDKERMKHFYYGSYGLGPWYFDMEERLHNPYFIGARAWNGPIEGWVNKNKVYPNDLPSQLGTATLLDAMQRQLGLSPEQVARIRAQETVKPSDLLTRPGGLLDGVVSRERVREHLAAM